MSIVISSPSGVLIESDPTALKLTGGAISGDLTVSEKVGIGGAVPTGANEKFAVRNGNLVFPNSNTGVKFSDGTFLSSTGQFCKTTGSTYFQVYSNLSFLRQDNLDPNQYAGTVITGSTGIGFQLGLNPNSATGYDQTSQLGASALSFQRTDKQLSISNDEIRMENLGDKYIQITPDNIGFYNSNQTLIANVAKLNGATFTGKINCTVVAGVAGINLGTGGTDAASTVAGDLWLQAGSSYLNFRDGSGVWRNCLVNNTANTIDVNTATSPALRITQRGAGNALTVEDSTNPDSTSFVVNSTGNVGIGVNPSSFAPTALLNLDVSVTGGAAFWANGQVIISGPSTLLLAGQTVATHSNPFSTYSNEIAVVINGVTRYIPYR